MHRRRATPSRRSTRSSARRWAARSRPCSAPPTSSASTPSSHVAKNCYDTLTDDERARRLQGRRRSSSRWSRRRCSATRPAAASTRRPRRRGKDILALDLEDAASTAPQAKARFDSLGAAKEHRTTSGERVAHGDDAATTRPRKFAERVTLRRAGLLARAASAEIADDMVNIDRAHALGLRLGPRALRDLGRARRAEGRRAHEGARHQARRAGSRRCWPRAATSFYGVQRPRTYWDVQAKRAKPVPRERAHDHASRASSAATRRSRATTARRCWDMGDGVALPRVPHQDERHRR